MMSDQLMTELFGGSDRYKVLRWLYTNPGRAAGPRELALEAQVDPGNASRLLRRWAAAGIVTATMQDRFARYSASSDPLLVGLFDLMNATSGKTSQRRKK